MLEEKNFDTGEIAINYVEGSSGGDPLLMLHGVTARWQSGMPLIPALSARRHVYALDFRGHGKSGRAPGAYTVQEHIRDVKAFILQVVKRPVAIYGHSLGGRVGLTAATEIPEMVSAVIVADTPLSTGSLERRSDFFKVFGVWREIALSGMSIDEMVPALAAILVSPSDRESKLTFGELPGWDQAYLRFTARYLRMVDPEILAGMAGGTAGESGRYDLLGMLPQVKCPTLFLQGNPEMGALLAEEDLQQALELMPSAVSVRIDHAGHDIHLQDAAAALRAVTLFLESI